MSYCNSAAATTLVEQCGVDVECSELHAMTGEAGHDEDSWSGGLLVGEPEPPHFADWSTLFSLLLHML